MRTAVTIARQHGKPGFELVYGPDTPLAEQKGFHKHLAQSRGHPVYAETLLFTGHTKRRQFVKSEPVVVKQLTVPPKPPKSPAPPRTPRRQAQRNQTTD
jgi:hypothetical protein